jgi:MFS family permease
MEEGKKMNATETVGGERPKKYVTTVVLIMGLIALMDNFLSQLEIGVIGYMVIDFGIDPTLLFAIFGIIAFAVFFVSWFTDAFGRRKGLILLVLVLGIPSTLLLLTPSGPAGLYPSVILYSIMTMGTLANTWEIPVAEESPAKKRGLYGAIAFLIGLVPIYAIIGPRVAEALGWKWAYGLFSIIMMGVCIPLLLFSFKETDRWLNSKNQLKNKTLSFITALKSISRKDWKYIMIFSIVYFIWGVSFKGGTLRFQLFFASFGDQAAYDKVYLLVGGLLTVVGALLSGLLLDKIGRKKTLVVGCVGSIVSFILVGPTRSPVALWGIFCFMPMVLAFITVYLAEIFPTKIRSTCTGVVVTFSRFSYIVGPALAFMSNFVDWSIYWIFIGLLMIIPLLALLMRPYEAMNKTLEEIEANRDGK